MKNIMTLWRRIKGRRPDTPAERLRAILPQHEGRRFEVDNFAMSRMLLKRIVPVVGVHPYPLNELLLMAAAVCVIQPRYIFEWGTHIGKSARLFYEVTEYFGLDTEIHSIDFRRPWNTWSIHTRIAESLCAD